MRKVLSFLMAVIFLFSGIPSYAITEGNNLEIVVNQGYDLYVDADSNDDSESNHNNFPNIDNYNFNSLNNDSIIAAKAFDKDNSEGIIAGFNLSTTTGESSSNSWYVYKEQSQPGKYESKKWFERGYRSNNWAHATEIDIDVYPNQGWPEGLGGSWIWSEKYGDGGGGLDSPIYLRNKILGIIEIGNQSLTTPEDTPIDITIPYEDVYGNEWKIILSNPSNGSVVNNGIGSLTYTPDLNFNGNDLFTVEVEDIDGLTDTATISIEVTPVDDDPKANDDNEVTDEETPVTIDVLVNDTDVDGGDKYIDSFEQGSNGSVTQSINELIYTPNVDFYGDDSFTYSLNGGSAATVYITVNNVDDPPTAIVDTEVTNEDTPITISVLDNDLNEDDGLIEIIDFSHGSIGTVTQSGDDLVYTPNLNENGNDTFTYTLNGGSSTTVNMTINAINDDPVAINDMVSTTLNTSVSVPVLDNDEDVEGDPINITSFGQGSYGDVVRDGVELVYTPKLVYTPNNEYVESDSFIYEINNISTATVTVVVDNSVPPSANNDAVETDEEVAITILVLENDTDSDGGPIFIESYTNPSNGTLVKNGDEFIYTPEKDFYGADTFTYQLNGGSEATVTITVVNIDDTPIANDDIETTDEDTTVNIYVLTNDIDIEDDTISIINNTEPDNGTVTQEEDYFIYTPDENFNDTDTFTYEINGGSTATVTINVIPVDDPPIAEPDTRDTTINTIATIEVLLNDTDIDGGDMVINTFEQGTNGTVTKSGDSLIYEPNTDFVGTDSFNYSLNGGSSALVTVNVLEEEIISVANDDSITMTENTSTNILVLANDIVSGEGSKVVTSVTQPENGNVVNQGDYVTYTPNPNFTGTDIFNYTLNNESEAQVTVTVNPASTGGGGSGGGGTTTSSSTINAVTDYFTIDQGETLTVDTSELLENDKDYENFESVQDPRNGSVSLSGSTVTFTPDSDFNGRAFFYYTIADGSDKDTTVVVVDVEEITEIIPESTPLGGGDPDELLVIEPEIVPLGAIDFSLPYIMGYPDITFRPEREITRAEMAAIFVRILGIDYSNPGEPIYSDVNPNDWYYKYVQVASRIGILNGYEEDMFKPLRSVTNAEIASVFSDYWELNGVVIDSEGDYFSDISGHWAEDMINRLYNAGVSVTYPDGTFRPNKFTTRTEVVIMVNRALNRAGDFREVSSFSDVTQSHWGYGAIEAATGYQEPESVRLIE